MELNKNGEMVYRGYRVTPLGTFAMFRIQAPGSGPVPKELEGHYTTPREVMQGIDRYMDSLKGKGRKKNVKEASTPTN